MEFIYIFLSLILIATCIWGIRLCLFSEESKPKKTNVRRQRRPKQTYYTSTHYNHQNQYLHVTDLSSHNIIINDFPDISNDIELLKNFVAPSFSYLDDTEGMNNQDGVRCHNDGTHGTYTCDTDGDGICYTGDCGTYTCDTEGDGICDTGDCGGYDYDSGGCDTGGGDSGCCDSGGGDDGGCDPGGED